MLDFLECDRDHTNILVYVDGDLNLFEKARNLTVNSNFNERLCIYRRKGLPNVGSITRRRARIAAIHNEIKELIQNTYYVFMIEDDTLFPYSTLKNLLNQYAINPHAGFISAIELGRWGFLHIGAWTVNDIYNVTQITSIKKPQSIQKIDAAGFYCCLTRYDYYKSHTFKPYEEILGPDVDYGLSLRKQGLYNYVVPIECVHMNKPEDVSFKNQDIIQIDLSKAGNEWNLTVISDINIQI